MQVFLFMLCIYIIFVGLRVFHSVSAQDRKQLNQALMIPLSGTLLLLAFLHCCVYRHTTKYQMIKDN